MGLKEVASAASLWRGWDYYKENRVLKWEQTGENTYDGIVKGSEGNSYAVHIDTAHVRSSKCSCPFAEGRRVVCKHMIALFSPLSRRKLRHSKGISMNGKPRKIEERPRKMNAGNCFSIG